LKLEKSADRSGDPILYLRRGGGALCRVNGDEAATVNAKSDYPE